MGTIAIIDLVAGILLKVVAAAPTIVKAGQDLKPMAAQLVAIARGENVTPEQRAAIEMMVDAQFAAFQEALPPAQPGDPDYVGNASTS